MCGGVNNSAVSVKYRIRILNCACVLTNLGVPADF